MNRLLALVLLTATAFAAETTDAFLTTVKARFAAWDADHDGRLSMSEIDRTIANASVRGEDAAAVVVLKRGSTDRNATVSLDEIEVRVMKHRSDAKSAPDYEALHRWALDRITKAPRELFATQPPQIDSIRQGKLGDCFCLAALRTVIQREPAMITTMIKPAKDGAHEVKVGDKLITVPPLTDGEIAMGASTNNGLWPLVYEKAVGLSRLKPDAQDATPFNVVTKGGSAGSMMSTLTGHEIKRWSCKTWRDEKDAAKKAALLDEVRKQFVSAFAEKRLVTGGTGPSPKAKKGPPGILYNHGYAVLGYDRAKDTVHLWNPHGDGFTPKGEPGLANGYAMAKGELHVPLTELVTFFGGFAFEQSK